MPELPEVETIKTAIDRAIGKATILNISVYNKNLREKIPDDLAKKIVGAKICAYERRAKYILIHLDNKICLIWHLGMSGQIKISSQELERAKHDHVVIETSNGFITYHDARRFGMLTYFDEKENKISLSKITSEKSGYKSCFIRSVCYCGNWEYLCFRILV